MRAASAIAFALVFCGAAHAEPYKGVVFAGGSVSDDVSAYAGAVFALPGASLGDGFAVKAAASGGRYDYEGGPGVVDAEYYGGSLALVHQWSGSWGWANVSAGARATQTNLSPDDPGNERAGFRTDAVLGTDGGLLLDERWRVAWYGEGGVRDESYLARLEVTRASQNRNWRVGVESVVQGDPNYRQESVGAVVKTKIAKDLELGVSAGASFQEGRSAEPYVTLSLSRLF